MKDKTNFPKFFFEYKKFGRNIKVMEEFFVSQVDKNFEIVGDFKGFFQIKSSNGNTTLVKQNKHERFQMRWFTFQREKT